MAIVPSDLAVQWSTDFETLFLAEFNRTVAVERARLDPLAMEIPLGDHQGHRVSIDWLGAAPQMRRWKDERRPGALSHYSWEVEVLDYEASIRVDMNALRDARFNPYEARIREMAQNAGRLRYNLLSDLIRNGGARPCYDGQFFFDTDHAEGDSGVQSNRLTGTGTSAAQVKADYYSAYAALCGFKDDKGEPLQPADFRPLVWIPNSPTLAERFEELQAALQLSNSTNVLANRFDLIRDPRLTDANDWFMFRVDTPTKPFIVVTREEPRYADNFGSEAGDDVFLRKTGTAGVEARMAATYGLWQKAVAVVNA